MPFYQMVCIAGHYREYRHLKDLVRQTALHIMDNGGVVRKLSSWGTQVLPQRMRRHGSYHRVGDYWTMDFDTSPRTLTSLKHLMSKDARVIRWTVLKQGEKVEDVLTPRTKTRVENATPFMIKNSTALTGEKKK